MADPKWKQFGNYSGPMFPSDAGEFKLSSDLAKMHVNRAFALTVQVESGGAFGGYCAYDGTAATAGLDQHIAVYPKALAHEDFNAEDDQGGFWKLLAGFALAPISEALELLTGAGWRLTVDGRLVYAENQMVTVNGQTLKVGKRSKVHGQLIRNELTPMNGVVPRNGPEWEQAARWARALRKPFADERTKKFQMNFGISHLIGRTWRRKLVKPLYRNLDISTVTDELSPPLDLTLCVFHAHSVNAPGAALNLLKQVLASTSIDDQTFPKKMMQRFANSSYGRWNDEIPSGRWARTRSAAMALGFWDEGLFKGKSAIMPPKFA